LEASDIAGLQKMYGIWNWNIKKPVKNRPFGRFFDSRGYLKRGLIPAQFPIAPFHLTKRGFSFAKNYIIFYIRLHNYVFINRYGMDTTRQFPNKTEEVKLIPFEFTIKLPDTQLFGNKPRISVGTEEN